MPLDETSALKYLRVFDYLSLEASYRQLRFRSVIADVQANFSSAAGITNPQFLDFSGINVILALEIPISLPKEPEPEPDDPPLQKLRDKKERLELNEQIRLLEEEASERSQEGQSEPVPNEEENPK